MAAQPPTRPVESSISKVNDEIAVGADLEFQKRWWRFERIVWIVFTVIIALDLAGAFGRGPLAKAHLSSANRSVDVEYERIARYQTPSNLIIRLRRQTVPDRKVQLWVSDSLVRELGNQRVVPQPQTSALDRNGILYTFPAGPVPDSVEFSMQLTKPGLHQFALRVSGSELLTGTILVMP